MNHRIRPLRRVCLTLAMALTLGGAAFTGLAPADAQADVPSIRKIAMVDMQRVLNETKEGKKARSRLESSTKKKQKKLDARRTKFESETASLQSLSGEQLAAAQEKLQRDYLELQNMYMTLQQELRGRSRSCWRRCSPTAGASPRISHPRMAWTWCSFVTRASCSTRRIPWTSPMS